MQGEAVEEGRELRVYVLEGLKRVAKGAVFFLK